MTIWAVLPAAGIGRRMGSSIPKQYLSIDGAPLILHSLRRLSAVKKIKKIVVVIHPAAALPANLPLSTSLLCPDRAEPTEG